MMLKAGLVQLVLIACVSARSYVGSNKQAPVIKLDIIHEAIELGGPVIKDGTPVALLLVKDEDSVTCSLDTDKLRLEDVSSEWKDLSSATTVYDVVVNGQLDVATDVPFFFVATCTDAGTPPWSTAVAKLVSADSSDESEESQESNESEESQESNESEESQESNESEESQESNESEESQESNESDEFMRNIF